MLFQPCRGQAMVCTVVLSAAALASQTHYSYLNEFSAAPLVPPPISAPLALAASALPPSLRSHESLSIFAITSPPPPPPCFPLVSRRSFRSSRDFASVPSLYFVFSSFFFFFFSFFSTVHRSPCRFLSPLGPSLHAIAATRDVCYREMKSLGMFASRRSRSRSSFPFLRPRHCAR